MCLPFAFRGHEARMRQAERAAPDSRNDEDMHGRIGLAREADGEGDRLLRNASSFGGEQDGGWREILRIRRIGHRAPRPTSRKIECHGATRIELTRTEKMARAGALRPGPFVTRSCCLPRRLRTCACPRP